MTPQQYAPLIGIAIAVPLILFRNRAPRVLHPSRMWIIPAIMILAMAAAIWGESLKPGVSHAPFGALDWLVIAVGIALGVVAGFWRGRMTTIERAPDGVLRAQASPIGLVLILALLLGRQFLRGVIEPHAAALGLNVLAVTDSFLLLALAMIVTQRIEMFIRATRIRAGKPDAHVEAVT